MRKLFWRAIGLVVIGFIGYSVYQPYRFGFFELPDMPEGSYAISFASGFRGIIIDADVSNPSVGERPKWMRLINHANPDRRYLGLPSDVPEWFNGEWSYCTTPTDEERASIPQEIRKKSIGARFDAVCRLALDNEETLVRGLIFSVPRKLIAEKIG